MPAHKARLGVIGGSGLYQMTELTDVEEVHVQTPFGAPSDMITLGQLGQVPIAFLPRHGRAHRLSPTEVPAQANIYALKSLGVEWVISVSAVGSLREHLAPLDLVLPDQLFDRTKSRPNSFFEGGVVVHASFADPFCPHLSGLLAEAAAGLGNVRAHRGGTYVCIEGPLFSTRAESHIYRQLGCDVIGMTALPEAKLAREAELCYAVVACVTDYDVWHAAEGPVTVEMVVANLARNVANAQRIIAAVAAQLPADRASIPCECDHALANAILTDRTAITAPLRERYRLLIGKYLEQE
jgi:5'-methylthioadenosine phosphorylase